MFVINAASLSIKPLDPVSVRQALVSNKVDPQTINKCNSIELKHGPIPGKAHMLLRRVDYDALINENSGSPPLSRALGPTVQLSVFDYTGSSPTFNHYQKWTLTNAVCVAGGPNDPDGVIYAIFEDIRWWAQKTATVANSFNVLRQFPANNGLGGETQTFQTSTSSWLQILNSSFPTNNLRPITGVSSSVNSATLGMVPYNVHIGNDSLLTLISKFCESLRIYLRVSPSGDLTLDDEVFDPTTLPSNLIYTQISSVYPSSVLNTDLWTSGYVTNVARESLSYNNESDLYYGSSINQVVTRFEQTILGSDTSGGMQCTLPYFFKNLPNSTVWDAGIASIATRLRSACHPESCYYKIRGHYTLTPRFGADKIIYSNYGDGLFTEIIGVDKHELNYFNPLLPPNTENPIRELWGFTTTTTFSGYTNATSNGRFMGTATANIYRLNSSFDALNSGNTSRRSGVTITDPLGICENHPLAYPNATGQNLSGVCEQIGDMFFVVAIKKRPKFILGKLSNIGIGSPILTDVIVLDSGAYFANVVGAVVAENPLSLTLSNGKWAVVILDETDTSAPLYKIINVQP